MPNTRNVPLFYARPFFILLFAFVFFSVAAWFGYNQQPIRAPLSAEPGWTEWAWWMEPVERNAFRRLASLSPTLHSVQFIEDRRRGWAVGSGGTILATDDGGRSWVAQNSGSKAELYAVQFLANGQHGWAVGVEGTMLTTNNGGHNWVAQTSCCKKDSMSVQFLADRRHGWAVGREGAIFSTDDGGRSWDAQTSGRTTDFNAVQFLADGRHGWVVGWIGDVLATVDGGRSWTAQARDNKEELYAVRFLADGRRGWVVGHGGTILATIDGGRSWVAQTSGIKESLKSVHFLADGRRGWIVGGHGTILTSNDSGKSWQSMTGVTDADLFSISFSEGGKEGIIVGNGVALYSHDGGANWLAPQYHRRLAPWVYAAWAFFILVTFLILRFERKTRFENVNIDPFISDEPVTLPENDSLGHRELVAALSAFLRNRRTVPPLSVAITAQWGKGKSSVMRLLQRSLRQHGDCTVWFNAWHHQKEEIVLAGLLENIRVQALPFWLRPWGLVFRFRMLFLRAVRHYAVASLVGIATWFGLTVLFEHGDKLPEAWRAIKWGLLLQLEWKAFVSQMAGTVAKHPHLFHVVLGLAAGGGALVFTLLYGLRAFPEHPVVLLATLSEKFKTRHAEAQTAFRYKFARHFSDVCAALRPRTLTLFIDDLDRCTPEKALETLEAVNYLVSSGACYVVLGMDKKVVESLVGLANEKLAMEMMAEGMPFTEGNGCKTEYNETPANKMKKDVAKRRAYAGQYLEKLVNFELPVPAAGAGEYLGMVNLRRDWKLVKLLEVIGKWGKLLVPYVFAVLASLFIAQYIFVWKPVSVAEHVLVLPTVLAPGKMNDPSPPRKVAPSDEKPNKVAPFDEKPSGGGFVSADPLNDNEYMVWLFAFTAVFSVFFWLGTRSRDVVDDSREFRKALKIWLPLAVVRRNSPRQAKRFVNHARFLAMRARGSAMEQGLREQLIFLEAFVPGAAGRLFKRQKYYRKLSLLDRCRRIGKLRHKAVGIWNVRIHGIPSEKLVALAAISYAFPDAIGSNSFEEIDSKLVDQPFDSTEQSAAVTCYNTAKKQHQAKFPSQWPPHQVELDTFRRWANALRQSGR